MTRAKTKVCGGCKAKYPRLPDHPPFRNWCDTPCAITIARKRQDKARERKRLREARELRAKEKANKKAVRELNRRDISWQHKQCKRAFNRMRVLEELDWFVSRGLQPECISCAKKFMDWCCGHFKTVKAQGNLRYDRKNTYLQCNTYCNEKLSGNIEGNKTTRGYKRGLIERFGEEEGQGIIDYCETTTATIKWDWRQMEADRARWAAKSRMLERQLREYGVLE